MEISVQPKRSVSISIFALIKRVVKWVSNYSFLNLALCTVTFGHIKVRKLLAQIR
jgi:hypothetical protein